jgi:hypothetical protein
MEEKRGIGKGMVVVGWGRMELVGVGLDVQFGLGASRADLPAHLARRLALSAFCRSNAPRCIIYIYVYIYRVFILCTLGME